MNSQQILWNIDDIQSQLTDLEIFIESNDDYPVEALNMHSRLVDELAWLEQQYQMALYDEYEEDGYY